jgi:hypothetical protein
VGSKAEESLGRHARVDPCLSCYQSYISIQCDDYCRPCVSFLAPSVESPSNLSWLRICALPYLVGDAVPMLCPQVHQHLAHLSEGGGGQAKA